MAISDRINEMYTHVGDVYDTITNVDLPTNKNIQNIPSTMRSSYLEIMNNGIDTIWNNWEKVEGTGTSLTLNNTEEAPMKIDLKGNTSQTQTTGKNLFAGGDTTTTNGITFTKHSDGSYDIVGTATSPAYILNYVPLAESGIVNGETYTISTNQNITGLEIRIESYNGNTWLRATLGGLITFPKTHSADVTGATSVRFGLFVNSGTTINLKNLKIQLEKGSSVTSFEPYTGGIPAPSPDYPQDIHVVSGDNSINVCGKNLLDTKVFENRLINCYVVNSNGTITQTATDTNYWQSSYLPNSIILNSGTYTISVNNRNGSTLQVYNLTTNSNIVERKVDSYTFTLTNDNQVINVKLYGASSYPFTFTMQLEKGSTATTYEPYESTSYPINLGVENLWNNQLSGFLPQSGSYPIENPSYPYSKYVIITLLKGQSITTKIDSDYYAGRIRYIDKDTNQVVGSIGVGNNNGYCNSSIPYGDRIANGTITALKDVLLGVMDYSFTPSSTSSLKVTYGTTPQYISDTPIELCKIGDYQDSIKKSTGKNLFTTENATLNKYLDTSGNLQNSSVAGVSDYIDVSKLSNVYLNYTGLNTGTKIYCYYDENKTFKTYGTYTTSGKSIDVSNYSYLRITYVMEENNTIMLNEGSTALPYEPYGKVWYLNKQIGKVVLDGSETINKGGTNTTNTQMFLVSVNGIITNVGNGILSDKFKTNINIWTYDEEGIRGNSIYTTNTCWVRINKNRLTDNKVADFKTWLSTNNVTTYYVLATPTYTEITNTTLISQLDTIKRSYDEQTNITQVNNDLPFILDVTALKQLTQ